MSQQVCVDHPPREANAPAMRQTVKLALALAVLATSARLLQLAIEPTIEGGGGRRSISIANVAQTNTAKSSARLRKDVNSAESELARPYAACPTAGLISLEEATASPDKVDALLPPFRRMAAREAERNLDAEERTGSRTTRLASESISPPRSTLPPAIPRIRYPVTLEPAAPHLEAQQIGLGRTADGARVAQLPRLAATSPATESDWLIDPREWYTPEEQAKKGDDASEPRPPAQAEPAPPSTTEPAQEAVEEVPGDSSDRVPSGDPLDPVRPEFEPPTPELDVGNQGAEAASAQPPSSPWQPPTESEQEATPPARPVPPIGVPPTDEIFPAPIDRRAVPQNDSSVQNVEQNTGRSPEARTQPPVPLLTAAQQENCGVDPHLELFAKNNYPSARECATCHEEIYEQWSVSAHAYAAVSPMFHKFEQKLNDLSQGTVGYFCMRCHAPVATALYASRAEPLWNLPEVAREGITCIACHRVKYVYGKSNGERRIEPGDVFAPVYGGVGGEGVADAIHRKAEFKVKTSADEKGPGQNIHLEGIYFDPLTRSEACTPCHQVAVHPGIKLEVVWEQYRASPACKKGIQCQDCHMGRVPGLPLGYEIGAIAKVNDKTVSDQRKKSNHIFHGPNYSIAHPGVFPFHLKANRWKMDEWLAFDWRAGWGTDAFEDRVADGEIAVEFPACWAEADDRYDARDILDDNFKKLDLKRENRRQVMENGSRVEGPFFDGALCRGEDIKFHYIFTNTNEGHNLLTASLGAQPQLWANIVLIGPDGRRLWETGYTDSYGDLANIHSVDVRRGRVPFDWQLFNLQTMFLITGAKGTDREFFVPVNLDIDQLPFIRPGVQPISVINHPPFIRMESQSLAALGSRKVPYRIPGELVQQPGKYRLSFRMRSRAEPLYFMRFCEATPEMERMMNEWMIDLHPMSVEFEVR